MLEADKAELRSEIERLRRALGAVVSEIKKYHPDFDARIFVEAERALKQTD